MPKEPKSDIAEDLEKVAPIAVGSVERSSTGGIKVRLTLGPALIDLEATLEEIVQVVTRLTQEFAKAKIIEVP